MAAKAQKTLTTSANDTCRSGPHFVTTAEVSAPSRWFEKYYNEHRAHPGIADTRLPEPITDRLTHLNSHRRDRLADILHEYIHAA